MKSATYAGVTALLLVLAPTTLRADDWPQWLGPKRDSVWRETGILAKFPEGSPKILWRAKVHLGYSGPAIADGRVIVTDYETAGDPAGNPNQRTALQGKERVLAFSVADGKLIWKHEYDCPYRISYPNGPRCTPTVDAGRVFALGAEGNLLCLDTATGQVQWSKDLKKEYKTESPMWGFCGHPLVDGKTLICLVGGDGSVAVAFDKNTGKELWRALSAKDAGYCPPTIIEAGGKRQLLIWHPDSINSLDPETGNLYWSVPLQPAYGMSITAPRQLGDYLFASGIGDQGLLLKLAKDKPGAEVVWKGTKKTAVYCANSTPFLEDDMIYGCECSQGQLRGVRLSDGERLWETFAPTTGKDRGGHGTAFIVKNGDRFFLLSETGHLIIAKLSPKGYDEISRCKLLEPTSNAFGRTVLWSHPAYANRCIFARNDQELVCASLAADVQ